MLFDACMLVSELFIGENPRQLSE